MTDEEKVANALKISSYISEYLKIKLWNSNVDDRSLVCFGLITQLIIILDASIDDKKVMNEMILDALKRGKMLSKQIQEEIENV